ncbi:hypothetical protein BD413DRAFT_247769 [Trametes elegans]|nr:hypothetical protein BD413DRAFT_247769 [Trametes elegans]
MVHRALPTAKATPRSVMTATTTSLLPFTCLRGLLAAMAHEYPVIPQRVYHSAPLCKQAISFAPQRTLCHSLNDLNERLERASAARGLHTGLWKLALPALDRPIEILCTKNHMQHHRRIVHTCATFCILRVHAGLQGLVGTSEAPTLLI